MFDDFFARRALTKLIADAGQGLRSQGLDLDSLVCRLCQTKEDISLIRAYISIQTAARLFGPPKGSDVDDAFHLLRATERHLDQPEFGEIFDIHRDLAEVLWRKRQSVQLRANPDYQAEQADDELEIDTGIAALRHRLEALVEGV
jgi:hypothetical protein